MIKQQRSSSNNSLQHHRHRAVVLGMLILPLSLLLLTLTTEPVSSLSLSSWKTTTTGRTTRQSRPILGWLSSPSSHPSSLVRFKPQLVPSSSSPLQRMKNYDASLLMTSGEEDTTDATPSEEVVDQEKLKKQRRRRISVTAVLASAFLNLLGFTMAGPITPALGKHFNLPIGAYFGSLTSAYPLGMLFGLFVWPTLSDSWGRKPIIASSLLGSGLGLMAQAVCISHGASLKTFLAWRVFTGAFAGSSPVSKAYLADIGYKDGKLPRYLALRDAASTMAFIVGPMLGGILFDIRRRMMSSTAATSVAVGAKAAAKLTKLEILSSTGCLSFVIGISAAASLIAAALVGLFVQDVKPPKNKKSDSSDDADSISESDAEQGIVEEKEEEVLVACPLGVKMWTGVASVCVVSFLFNVGDSTFHAFFSALLKDAAGKAVVDIGLLYTLLACISFVVSTTGTSWLMKVVGPVITCALGLSCVGVGLSALGVAASPSIAFMPPTFAVLAAAAAIYYCGVPLYGPTIPTMLLRCVPSHRRGAIMGLDGTINTIARIISPLVMGDIYRRYGAGTAFGLAGMATFLGGLTALFRRFVVLRDLYARQNNPPDSTLISHPKQG